jgi:hypothetical protein
VALPVEGADGGVAPAQAPPALPQPEPPASSVVPEPSSLGTPRKKKKKKKKRGGGRVPSWVWWWGSLTAVVVLTVVGLVSMAMSGYRLLALYCTVSLLFALPFSTVVFAASLFVSNWFGAGIELVEFGTLIPKALLLILLASLVGLMPCGGLIALGVWFIGSMLFFQLEAWETRFLVGFNWALGWVFWLFGLRLVGSVLTAMATQTK